MVQVKNCLGHVTFVAIDCDGMRMMSGDGYGDSIREVLRKRYRAELNGSREDPLQWINREAAREAYRSRPRRQGTLVDD